MRVRYSWFLWSHPAWQVDVPECCSAWKGGASPLHIMLGCAANLVWSIDLGGVDRVLWTLFSCLVWAGMPQKKKT